MTNKDQPGTVIAQLCVTAEAEVIPGPESQMKWALDYIQQKYNPVNGEHGPELAHFEETDE